MGSHVHVTFAVKYFLFICGSLRQGLPGCCRTHCVDQAGLPPPASNSLLGLKVWITAPRSVKHLKGDKTACAFFLFSQNINMILDTA